MSLGPAVLPTNMSEMVIELVNQNVGIVEMLLAGDVNRLITVNIATQSPLLPTRQPHPEAWSLYAVVL